MEEIRRKTPGKQKKEEASTSGASNVASSSTNPKLAQSAPQNASVIQTDCVQNGSLTDHTQIKLETVPSDALDAVRQTMNTLQAQIDQLQVLQNNMDAKIQQLNHSDRLILNEFVNLNQSMVAKDNLIRQLLHVAVKQEQAGASNEESNGQAAPISSLASSGGSETQKLLDTYTRISQSNAEHMETIMKRLEQVNNVPTSWSEPETSTSLQHPVRQETFLSQQPTVPSQPLKGQPQTTSQPMSVSPIVQPSFGYQDQAAAAAAAAANMNAGSLIGSHVPLKNGDGLAFVTLGRLSSNMSFTDNRPALEIKMQPEASSSQEPVVATGSSSGQVPSQTMPNSMNAKKKGGIHWSVPPRVLLVDDDSVYRDLSGKLLQIIGCSIDLAKDGVEAIRKMGAEKYDLILMVCCALHMLI